MKPTLLALAAGMGSRYGALKQLDGLGPSGETIIDYSIYDAVQCGFGKVVFVVRESFRKEFEDLVHRKYGNFRCPDGELLETCFVTQELDKIPAGISTNPERVKPWGTAHAILMAKDVIHEPFAVINGDDYYGKDSFKVAQRWMQAHAGTKGQYAIIGFRLDNTLSDNGSVSRGICSSDKDGNLVGVVECLEVMRDADGIIRGLNTDTQKREELRGEDLCSMNMWCFTPDYLEASEKDFAEFLTRYGMELKKEFFIPLVVDRMIKSGAKVELLGTSSQWFGVTFPEDRPGVVSKFAELVRKGLYPTPLY